MRKAFKMKLYEGKKEEYKKSHDAFWQEMKDMIHNYGGHNYSIFFDEETNTLFEYIEFDDENLWNKRAEAEICKKWWDYMADIMQTNEDNSPVSSEPECVFHLE